MWPTDQEYMLLLRRCMEHPQELDGQRGWGAGAHKMLTGRQSINQIRIGIFAHGESGDIKVHGDGIVWVVWGAESIVGGKLRTVRATEAAWSCTHFVGIERSI
jgi:hypothetical protein